jgi:hypothetical protein
MPPGEKMVEALGKTYDPGKALCICLEGTTQYAGSHGEAHAFADHVARKKYAVQKEQPLTVAKYINICAIATAKQTGCEPGCIEAQLNGSFTTEQKATTAKYYQSRKDDSWLVNRLRKKIESKFGALPKIPEP